MDVWMKTKQMFEADLLMECEICCYVWTDRMDVRDQMCIRPVMAHARPVVNSDTASLWDFNLGLRVVSLSDGQEQNESAELFLIFYALIFRDRLLNSSHTHWLLLYQTLHLPVPFPTRTLLQDSSCCRAGMSHPPPTCLHRIPWEERMAEEEGGSLMNK
ncbi:hypothetical protein QQF64_006969 [Cirrhinus molitorella]|uniref:Uncharacterized protein n=1 Tax=Cirrhinus molitorella TaxID=172907 RepID=A0ABR3MCK3_9TELE